VWALRPPTALKGTPTLCLALRTFPTVHSVVPGDRVAWWDCVCPLLAVGGKGAKGQPHLYRTRHPLVTAYEVDWTMDTVGVPITRVLKTRATARWHVLKARSVIKNLG
jgi:hypothetical protein